MGKSTGDSFKEWALVYKKDSVWNKRIDNFLNACFVICSLLGPILIVNSLTAKNIVDNGYLSTVAFMWGIGVMSLFNHQEKMEKRIKVLEDKLGEKQK